MAVSLGNLAPTSARIHAATTDAQLDGIEAEVKKEHGLCKALAHDLGDAVAPMPASHCDAMAAVLYGQIDIARATLPVELTGKGLVITSGDSKATKGAAAGAAAGAALAAVGTAGAGAPAGRTLLILAVAGVAAWALWRWTR